MNYFNPIEVLMAAVLIVGLLWLITRMIKNSLLSLLLVGLIVIAWVLFTPLNKDSNLTYETKDFYTVEAFNKKTKLIYNEAKSNIEQSFSKARKGIILDEEKR